MSWKLKSVRAAHRVITRLLNHVNGNPEELLREHKVNGLFTIKDLIRKKEKTILKFDAKILEEISEDEHGEEITEADSYTFDIQMTISKHKHILHIVLLPTSYYEYLRIRMYNIPQVTKTQFTIVWWKYARLAAVLGFFLSRCAQQFVFE